MGTEVTTIPVIYHSYKVANVAAMNALTGMRSGEFCIVDDIGAMYRYSGSAWELVISSLTGIVWKDAQPSVLTLTNQVADVAFTDLDLTADTSAIATKAILQAIMHCDSYNSGNLAIYLRKNGTNPTIPVRVIFPSPVAGKDYYSVVIVGLDPDEILEYALVVDDGQMDASLHLLGYIE